MKATLASALLVSTFLLSGTASAHPGGLASDGCHYCRTNCAAWGETYGTRHCHRTRQKEEVAEETIKKITQMHRVEEHEKYPHSHEEPAVPQGTRLNK